MNEKNGVASIGVWFFSVVAAIGLILAAVAFLQSSADPWLKVAIGLGAGIAFIVLAERMDPREISRTRERARRSGDRRPLRDFVLDAMHAGSGLVPLVVSFPAMLVVTAAAVWLATRHDSKLIAVLGLLGGFVTAYLLAPSGSNAARLVCLPPGAEHRNRLAHGPKRMVAAQLARRDCDGALRMELGRPGRPIVGRG